MAALYELYLDLENHTDGVQQKALCPFHEEQQPSFFVEPDGNWYCFGCGEGGGPITFLQKYLGINKQTAQYAYDYYKAHNKNPLPSDELVERYHDRLMEETELISYFGKMGVGGSTLKEFKIGWDMRSKRIVFPIPSRYRPEYYVNLRKYRPAGAVDRSSKLINISNLGQNIYYPYKAFDEDTIYIVEGEKDMLVSRARGINAITGTGGATVPKVDSNLFRDKEVFLMLDADEAGDRLAEDYYNKLKNVTDDITRIRLPEKDYTDTIVANPNINIHDYEVDLFEGVEDEEVEVRALDFMNSPEEVNKIYRSDNLRVIGEDMTSFQVPSEVTLSDREVVTLEPRDYLKYIGTQDHILEKQILAGRDDDVTIVDRKDVMVKHIYFRPDINMYDSELSQSDSNSTAGLYVSEDGTSLKTNRVYNMKLMRSVHPKTQENIFIILEAEEAIMDSKVDIQQLEVFRSEEPIEQLMEKYYDDWSPHLEVNGRQDLFEAMLLTYLSVLEFKWRNSVIKGRLDTIVVGDTRTGKTKMIRNFMNTLRIGEYVSGENAKATGIIGGINNIKNTWTLNWGKIPINDKRLVVIDEASGLSVSDITDLSQMRSEGILSITKIKQESTYARTRLLWITNPRSGKKVSEHLWNGYTALQEFLPVQEDLARFDLAVSASIKDVEDIFDYSESEIMDEEEIERWRSLILFAWSLDAEDISFSEQAEQDLMSKSIILGRKFNEEPLFMSVNGYEKLARIAIAAAIITFNLKGGDIVVEERHVEYAVNLLLRAYSKDTFGLVDKAIGDKARETISDDTIKELRGIEVIYDNLDNLFRKGSIAVSMVPTILGVDREGADTLVSRLYNLGLVDIGSDTHTLEPTPAYLDYIRKKGDRNNEDI